MIVLGVLLRSWKLLLALAAILGAYMIGVRLESAERDRELAEQERRLNEAFRREIEHARRVAEEVSMELNDAVAKRELDAIEFRKALDASRRSGKALAVCPEPAPAQSARKAPLASEQARMPVPERPPEPRELEPPAAPRGPVFTAEFARLYDLALAPAGLSTAADTGGADAPAEGAATVDPETVLAVHAANAEAWGDCRDRLTAWQQLARAHGWVR